MADDVVDPVDAPAPDISTPDTPTVGDITQPTPETPDYNALFDEPAPDPNAPPEPPTEPDFGNALAISEFVKDPQQLEGAVRAFDDLTQVQNGAKPVSDLLEGFRAQNPAGYEKMVRENLIPYIEQITGQKLGGQQEPKSPEQQRIDALEAQFQQRQQADQQAQQQAQVARAENVAGAKLTELTKGTFLEGQNVLAALGPFLKIPVAESMKQVLQGNTSSIEVAFKGLQKQREADGRAYAKWAIANHKTLQKGLPASKGKPATSSSEPNLEGMTKEERIAYLAGTQ